MSNSILFTTDTDIGDVITISSILFNKTSGSSGVYTYVSDTLQTAIPDNMFHYGNNISFYILSVIIPYSVTILGSFILNNQTFLSSVTIPSSVITIGDGIFDYAGLTSMDLFVLTADRNTKPDEIAVFSYMSSIYPSIVLQLTYETPSDYIKIGFNNDETLYTIINGVQFTKIHSSTGNYVYQSNEYLSIISPGFFSGKTTLISIVIPLSSNNTNTTGIGNNTFLGCTALNYVSLSPAITNIGDNAFQGCSSLTTINIPIYITSLSSGIFQDCIALTSIVFLQGISLYSINASAFQGCSSLVNITIPAKVNYLGNSAFKNCASLTSIQLPPSISFIDNSIFY